MTRQPVDMGEGRVLTVLFRLGAPAMISMFFETLYALVDTIFVARLGTIPLAAMSLAIPLLFLAMALGKGVAIGSLSAMSHARGAERPERAKLTAAAAWPLVLLLISPLVLLALPVCNRPLFALFDADPVLLRETAAYTRWLALSFPFLAFAMLCEGILFSYGDTKTPMRAMVFGNLVNMALDPLLIFSCGLGVAGASLASLIGWALSGAIMWLALRRHDRDRPGLIPTADRRRAWPEIISLGSPAALSMLIVPLSAAGLNWLLASFGPVYVGAWNLSARIEQILILPLYGLSSALIPFIGFNLGRGQHERIRAGCRTALYGCYLLLVPMVLLFWFVPEHLIGIFRPAAGVLTAGAFALKAVGPGYLFTPFELILTGLSQGLKKPRYSLMINALRLLALRLPLAWIFSRFWGAYGVYIALSVSFAISGLASLGLMRRLLGKVSD
ncbi:MAG: MATE family efflux transporter [Deltaproteobacteria bacterium]|nr:MATE family efflux transporter [Deltaproteobacteria bacterium]